MSWIQKLYETYENCKSLTEKMPAENEVSLLPICHTTQKAQIEIVVDQNGNFKRARLVPREDSKTIIPCTEDSCGRTRDLEAHPLSDKLQYVAGDYTQYGGNKKAGHEKYLQLLKGWCSSKFQHPKAISVYKYSQKNRVIQDLIDQQIMFVSDDGKLLKKWDDKTKKEKPVIFSLFQGEGWQADAFVRWEVEANGDSCSKTWEDLILRESWINYYKGTKKDKILCYVSGENLFKTDKQPKKIRSDGDGAKLISSNDTDGFTFLGRFTSAEQACGIGFEITQKAHNALRWLIGKQGKVFYVKGDGGKTNPGLTIVAWAISGATVPKPFEDTLGLFDNEEIISEITSANTTAQHFALTLKKLISGYSVNLRSTEGVVVLGLDSATPGRMAVTFYRELTGSEFLARVQDWHESCAWWQDYGKDKETEKPIRFLGAPSPADIAVAAYGQRIDDKLRKATVERILPCIVDGLPLPRDIVESAVRHVCNRIGMEPWEWEKSLGIACAIYKKYYAERSYNMALEENRRTRDYLYGRLLALADSLEGWALKESGEKRETNAARLMQRFASHPYSTWKNIELALSPYKARLGGKAKKYNDLISCVHALFEGEDYLSDKPLSGEFLLGYHCQRKALFQPTKVQETDEQDDN